MSPEKIARINFLAKKSKREGLTDDEKLEQKLLRDEYRASVLGSLRQELERVEIKEPDGSITKLRPKS